MAEDDIKAAEQAFIAEGNRRCAAALEGLKDLSTRIGGVTGLAVAAIHGSLLAYTSALLNHIAGIPDPNKPAEDVTSSDLAPEAPEPQADPAPEDMAQPKAPPADPVAEAAPEAPVELPADVEPQAEEPAPAPPSDLDIL